MRNHPRTTGKSMRELARVTATQGSLHVTNSLDYGYAWLVENRSKLPREVEDDNGNRNVDQRLEVLTFDGLMPSSDLEPDLESGLYDVARHQCYASLDQIAARNAKHAALYAEFGLVHHVYIELMHARGKLLRNYHHTEGRRRVLITNPERYGMDAIMKRGISRTRTVSRSVVVPDSVTDLLTYDGKLRWAVSRGTKASGSAIESPQVKIAGIKYSANRIIYRLVHGVDAGPLNVSDDGLTASPYRDNVNVSISERHDGGVVTYDIIVNLPKPHTLAACPTREIAEGVKRGVLWTINHL
jgi:hypothetical protein